VSDIEQEKSMADIRPFRGLRPTPDAIKDVASPPYDVLNSDEAREKVQGHPDSFLHVVKPEIDLNPSVEIYDPQVYAKGAENLQRLIQSGIMFQDETPCFYIYQLQMGDHVQTGLVAASSVEEYIQNKIKKHEFTRPDKEQDRMNHIKHLNAQSGPVFLTYRSNERIDALMKKGMKKDPVYDFTGDYDVRHTFYVVRDEGLIQDIQNAFAALDALYVADGHHRSAAAARVRNEYMERNPDHTGQEEYNYFLTVIFPDSQMKILDYNRVVKDLNGLTVESFLSKISGIFDVDPYSPCCGGCNECGETQFRPTESHYFGMYLQGQWYSLRAKENTFAESDPIKSLDASILQENLLSPILGIQDPRTDKRIHFVGGIRGLEELERIVDNGDFQVAFSLFPTGIDQLMAVADADQVMPPKSTWFEPKLASGVVVHLLD
jgi:uncharacterized protein (DUF1015 family)